MVAISIGGMVGGIFAVLGLAVQLAQGGTPVVFALEGMVAMLARAAIIEGGDQLVGRAIWLSQ